MLNALQTIGLIVRQLCRQLTKTIIITREISIKDDFFLQYRVKYFKNKSIKSSVLTSDGSNCQWNETESNADAKKGTGHGHLVPSGSWRRARL